MRPLVTPEEMAAADKAAVDSGTPVEVLMERAGRAVARSAIEMLGGRYGKKVVVVCGKGNNGGDGYAAARVLAHEGIAVRCLAVVDPSELKGAARFHYEKAAASGVPVRPFEPERLAGDLIIDAILGTGFKGHLDRAEPTGKAVDSLWDLKFGEAVVDDGDGIVAGPPVSPIPMVLSIDIPSGMDGARGVVEGPCVAADVTISMAAEKLGVFLAPSKYTGRVEVADIRINSPEAHTFVIDRPLVVPPRRPEHAHKRSRGGLAILAGSDAMPGAAALVARAAMRSGCGYVSLGCTRVVAEVVNGLCPEVIVHVVSDQDHLGPDAIEQFASVLERATAVAAGPGLGIGPDQRSLVMRLIEEARKPLLLDADALNALENEMEVLATAQDVTITPHPAELARLLGVDVQKVQEDRVEAAREAAKRSDAVVLLKGYRSVIAGAERSRFRIWLNPTGGPELATAGTGDVLTGVVGAYLAFPYIDGDMLVAAAAYVHGLSGSLAAERASDSGVVAWDVAEALPEAMALIREGVSL